MKKNNLFVWIIVIVLVLIVFLLPIIYEYIEKYNVPKVYDSDEIIKEETDTDIDEDNVVIHYPKMRSSVYNKNTYYSLSTFDVSNMSNEDILLNAFLDIYEGNITSYEGKVSCTNNSMQVNADYINLRIKNILGKNINYTHDSFYVPEDSNSNFTGDWKYDKNNKRYIYYGLCKSLNNGIKYYDLEQLIKQENNEELIVYYYVGFAKVEGNAYYIYSDYQMTNLISSGEYNNQDLLEIYKSLSNEDKKIYKYTFKNDLCTYDEYCLYKGEWVDGF